MTHKASKSSSTITRMIRLYTLKSCDSCRKATKWLKQHNIPFEETAIRDQPPTTAELKRAADDLDGNIRKLFNTSGQDYLTLNLKEKIAEMSEDEALMLLNQNGNLIKRPFLISKQTTLVGFKPEIWEKSLL